MYTMRSVWKRRWFLLACVLYLARCTDVQINSSSQATLSPQHMKITADGGVSVPVLHRKSSKGILQTSATIREIPLSLAAQKGSTNSSPLQTVATPEKSLPTTPEPLPPPENGPVTDYNHSAATPVSPSTHASRTTLTTSMQNQSPMAGSLKTTPARTKYGPAPPQPLLVGGKDRASTDSTLGMAAMPTRVQPPESAICNTSSHCGPNACVYKKQEAKCSWVNCLPTLPGYIRVFHMTYGRLPHLTRCILGRLSNKNIRDMHLTSNDISRLDPDTFADFPHLKLLDLSRNSIPPDQLHTGLKSITSPTFRTLRLNSMSLTALPDKFFDMFTNRSLLVLSLQDNDLWSFSSAVVAPFRKITVLNLSSNDIDRVKISSQVNVEKLILRKTQFREFPDLCFNQTPATVTSAFNGLLRLEISGPFKDIPPHRLCGACLPDLQRLDISLWNSNMDALSSNFIADLPSLEHLSLTDMDTVQNYEPFTFSSSSLKTLRLVRNGKIKGNVVEVEKLLQNCPNLQNLSIIDTPQQMTDTQMWQMLSPLKSLTFLHLEKMGMPCLLPNLLALTFPRLKALSVIDTPLEISDVWMTETTAMPITSLIDLHLEKVGRQSLRLLHLLRALPNLQVVHNTSVP